MSLLTRSVAYKPFQYPWAFDAFKTQNQLHWLPDEIALADDVQDWNKKLTPSQRNLVTHIFRLFTQSDEEIGNAYIDQYMPRFKNNELRMMFLAFGNMEAIHMQSYSYLLDTIGMPETEYSAFLEYTEMRDKYELLQNYKMDTHHNTALSMAVFAAFTEGLQLFASFAMLMNFPRFNLMKNMGQIVTFSIRDEGLHVQSIMKLFHEYLDTFSSEIDKAALETSIRDACRTVVDNEDRFIDLAFEMGPVEGLNADQMKEYIRWIADMRLEGLGYSGMYHVQKNPLPWLDDMLNAVEHTNFFENRSTEYSRAATGGDWGDVF